MNIFKIVALEGDGDGRISVGLAIRTLRVLEPSLRRVGFSIEEYPCGAAEYQRGGMAMRPRTWKSLRACHAILAGRMGLDDVRDAAGLEIEPQLDIRERLKLSRELGKENGVEAHAGEKHGLFLILGNTAAVFEAVAMMLEFLGNPETVRGAKQLRETVVHVNKDGPGERLAERVIRKLSS